MFKMLSHPLCKVLSLYLAVAVLALSFPAQGWAMIVPADREAVRADDLSRIQTTLESSMVRQRLMDYGLTSEEAVARVNTLSDEELHQFAANMDAVQAGGSILGDVLVVLLIVLIVILILEVTGHRVVTRR
jgi:hypothetical protein